MMKFAYFLLIVQVMVRLGNAANDTVCSGQKESYQGNRCCGENASPCVAKDATQLMGKRHVDNRLGHDAFHDHSRLQYKHEYINVRCPPDDDYIVTEPIKRTVHSTTTITMFGKGGSWIEMDQTNVTISYSARTNQTCTNDGGSRRSGGGAASYAKTASYKKDPVCGDFGVFAYQTTNPGHSGQYCYTDPDMASGKKAGQPQHWCWNPEKGPNLGCSTCSHGCINTCTKMGGGGAQPWPHSIYNPSCYRPNGADAFCPGMHWQQLPFAC